MAEAVVQSPWFTSIWEMSWMSPYLCEILLGSDVVENILEKFHKIKLMTCIDDPKYPLTSEVLWNILR
jgi:hypothetical protein